MGRFSQKPSALFVWSSKWEQEFFDDKKEGLNYCQKIPVWISLLHKLKRTDNFPREEYADVSFFISWQNGKDEQYTEKF